MSLSVKGARTAAQAPSLGCRAVRVGQHRLKVWLEGGRSLSLGLLWGADFSCGEPMRG